MAISNETIERMVKDAKFVSPEHPYAPQLFDDLCRHVKALAGEVERLRSALEIISQVRHVSGSAQGAFRSNVAIADAALAGADLRELLTVEAVASGTWHTAAEPERSET